jgi:hypothetical protein
MRFGLQHFHNNKHKYYLAFFALFAGVLLGFVFAGATASEHTADFVQGFLRQFTLDAETLGDIFFQALIANLRFLILLFLAGVFARLRLLAPFALVLKGFSAGYTLGFATLAFGGKGFLLAFVSILPQALTLYPLLFCAMVCAFNASGRGRLRWLLRCGAFALGIIICSLIDGLVVPVFVGGVGKLF